MVLYKHIRLDIGRYSVTQGRVKKAWIIHVYSQSANGSFLMDCAPGAPPCSIPTEPCSPASCCCMQPWWWASPESQTGLEALIPLSMHRHNSGVWSEVDLNLNYQEEGSSAETEQETNAVSVRTPSVVPNVWQVEVEAKHSPFQCNAISSEHISLHRFVTQTESACLLGGWVISPGLTPSGRCEKAAGRNARLQP